LGGSKYHAEAVLSGAQRVAADKTRCQPCGHVRFVPATATSTGRFLHTFCGPGQKVWAGRGLSGRLNKEESISQKVDFLKINSRRKSSGCFLYLALRLYF